MMGCTCVLKFAAVTRVSSAAAAGRIMGHPTAGTAAALGCWGACPLNNSALRWHASRVRKKRPGRCLVRKKVRQESAYKHQLIWLNVG